MNEPPDPLLDDTRAELDAIRAFARKAAAVSLLFSTVAVAVFWAGWVRAPAPPEVCKHKIELVFETASQDQVEGADALVSQLEVKCVDKLELKIQMRGKVVYAEYAKCVSAATSLADAERC